MVSAHREHRDRHERDDELLDQVIANPGTLPWSGVVWARRCRARRAHGAPPSLGAGCADGGVAGLAAFAG